MSLGRLWRPFFFRAFPLAKPPARAPCCTAIAYGEILRPAGSHARQALEERSRIGAAGETRSVRKISQVGSSCSATKKKLSTGYPQARITLTDGFIRKFGLMKEILIAVFPVLCVGVAVVLVALAVLHRKTDPKLRRDLNFTSQKLQTVQQELTDLEETVRQLANRVKMQRVRNAINHIDRASTDEPAPSGSTSIKDALRRKAGLIAGQPARHS